jgi:hypothetical protein
MSKEKYLIVRGNPGHPIEQTEGSKELVWDPIIDEKEDAENRETHKKGDFPTINDLALVVSCYEGSV